jgi:hypothetical protein
MDRCYIHWEHECKERGGNYLGTRQQNLRIIFEQLLQFRSVVLEEQHYRNTDERGDRHDQQRSVSRNGVGFLDVGHVRIE